MSIKIVCQNKKALHDYHIETVLEAGVMLKGAEVKSLRAGRANLVDAYAHIRAGELILANVHITPYQYATHEQLDPLRERKLLMHRREIDKLAGRVREKGLALIPLKIYFNDKGKAKVALALARGKKQYDKRADLKKKEGDREIERGYKRSR
ncbi:MAG: SsrA-binding protein SmpB [Thermodesulfobacteriota bacterium]